MKPKRLLRYERDHKRGSPSRTDPCLQRARSTAPDCVKKRDPHNSEALDVNNKGARPLTTTPD
jgi:hypothetical protein